MATDRPVSVDVQAANAKESVFVVFSYGDPMPITACKTAKLAEQYAAALGRLPKHHPLYTESAVVDELPLLSELPAPLLAPENQEWDESVYSDGPQTYGA